MIGSFEILGDYMRIFPRILKILNEDLVELVRCSKKYDLTMFKVVHVISLSADIIRTPYNHLYLLSQFITLLQIYNMCDSVCINNNNVKAGFKNRFASQLT